MRSKTAAYSLHEPIKQQLYVKNVKQNYADESLVVPLRQLVVLANLKPVVSW